jgi:hypothetical protein
MSETAWNFAREHNFDEVYYKLIYKYMFSGGNCNYNGRQTKTFQKWLKENGHDKYIVDNEKSKELDDNKINYNQVIKDFKTIVREFEDMYPYDRAFCIHGFTNSFNKFLRLKAPMNIIEELEAELERLKAME